MKVEERLVAEIRLRRRRTLSELLPARHFLIQKGTEWPSSPNTGMLDAQVLQSREEGPLLTWKARPQISDVSELSFVPPMT